LKIGHAGDLAAAITAFRLGLPPPMVAAIAVALPPLEVLLGIYLIAGLLLPLSSAAAATLLGVFTIIVASAVVRGLAAPCGCFGPGDNQPATWLTVARDVSFLVPAMYLVWWSRVRVTAAAPSASG
jgi:putative oxidoreductase